MTQDEYGEINQGRRGPPHPAFDMPPQPPCDNEHIAPGSERFAASRFDDPQYRAGFDEAMDLFKRFVSRMAEGEQSVFAQSLVPVDGYMDAFYDLASLLKIGAQDKAPREVFDEQMLPQIKELVRARSALQNIVQRYGYNDGGHALAASMYKIATDALQAGQDAGKGSRW